jgi:hypothetical protein
MSYTIYTFLIVSTETGEKIVDWHMISLLLISKNFLKIILDLELNMAFTHIY